MCLDFAIAKPSWGPHRLPDQTALGVLLHCPKTAQRDITYPGMALIPWFRYQ